MKQNLSIVLIIIILGIGFLLLINKKEEAPNSPGDAVSATPLFEDYAVAHEDIFTGEPAPVDLSSSSIGEMFRTRLTEGVQEGPNFAGHYTVVSWGCGTMCAQFVIIDAETGTIFNPEQGFETGIEYRLDSRLLVLNPINEVKNVYPDASMIPEWLTTQYYEWTGESLELVDSFKVIEGGIIDTGPVLE